MYGGAESVWDNAVGLFLHFFLKFGPLKKGLQNRMHKPTRKSHFFTNFVFLVKLSLSSPFKYFANFEHKTSSYIDCLPDLNLPERSSRWTIRSAKCSMNYKLGKVQAELQNKQISKLALRRAKYRMNYKEPDYYWRHTVLVPWKILLSENRVHRVDVVYSAS